MNGQEKHLCATLRVSAVHVQLSLHTCFLVAIDCGPLEPPENGAVRVPGTLFGFAVRYDCSVGYKLVGLPTRVCQDNGQWSGTAPVCQRKSIIT